MPRPLSSLLLLLRLCPLFFPPQGGRRYYVQLQDGGGDTAESLSGNCSLRCPAAACSYVMCSYGTHTHTHTTVIDSLPLIVHLRREEGNGGMHKKECVLSPRRPSLPAKLQTEQKKGRIPHTHPVTDSHTTILLLSSASLASPQFVPCSLCRCGGEAKERVLIIILSPVEIAVWVKPN